MCNNLATELAHFDYLKEKDIRDVLIDFVNTQHEHMQKVPPPPLISSIISINLFIGTEQVVRDENDPGESNRASQ